MIRIVGFLTGVAVTGTVLLLLADERALESTSHLLDQLAIPPAAEPAIADDPAFAATPGPADLRAGPGWIAGSSTPAGIEPPATDPDDPVPEDIPMTPPPARTDPTPAETREAPPATADTDASPVTGEADPATSDDASIRSVVDVAADAADSEAAIRGADTAPLQAAGEPAAGEPAAGDLSRPPGAVTDDADQSEEGRWFAFWTPFRSRASAQGFATHLGTSTGQEIRVLRMGPGEYRVAFFHSDEDERRRQLTVLEQASGLTLGGEL